MDMQECTQLMRGALDAIWDEIATMEVVWEVLDNGETTQAANSSATTRARTPRGSAPGHVE